ncbi:MAG: hypothetical protein A3E01_18520 [Gammaproteobacteria bacterium RIFCSPHIGHO2_12_FULL_63_22]|nr:MAG: hypothetical protein A3E01_18520 [Gammaproteobacteria bacterium RIFCSPHIGHO2_12_FULL_63_22]
MRKTWWGYEPDEQLSNDELIKEADTGIHFACPAHTEKGTLLDLPSKARPVAAACCSPTTTP